LLERDLARHSRRHLAAFTIDGVIRERLALPANTARRAHHLHRRSPASLALQLAVPSGVTAVRMGQTVKVSIEGDPDAYPGASPD
jgi:hypothetical protein